MRYTVRDLLISDRFPGMQLLCEGGGLDREIMGIRILHRPDMARFMRGGGKYSLRVCRPMKMPKKKKSGSIYRRFAIRRFVLL